jgi:hypothetical protein
LFFDAAVIQCENIDVTIDYHSTLTVAMLSVYIKATRAATWRCPSLLASITKATRAATSWCPSLLALLIILVWFVMLSNAEYRQTTYMAHNQFENRFV